MRSIVLACLVLPVMAGLAQAQNFVNWENPHVHPLETTPDGTRLLAVNTADNRLEVFDLSGGAPVKLAAIPVGLDPVSVRARSNTEAWVVSHISDSVNIVSLSSLNVVRSLRTDDEPCDVVFAPGMNRAFVSCSYPATYGTLFAVVSLLFLLRHILKRSASDFYVSCAALALAALCKVEIIFTVAVMHAVFVLFSIIQRRFKKFYLLGYSAAALIPVAIYGYFYSQVGSLLMSDNLFISGNVAASGFTLRHSGFDDVAASLSAIGRCLIAYAACFAFLFLASRAAQIAKNSAEVYFGIIAISALICAGVIYASGPFLILRALPFALFCALAYHAIRARKASAEIDLALTILFATALAGLARIILRAGAEHYGFYLSVPAMIAATVLWTRDVPLLASRKTAAPGTACYVGVAVMLGLSATHLAATQSRAKQIYGPQGVSRVQTAMGTMPIAGFYQGSVDATIADLAEIAKGSTVVVIPEGVTITFLAGARNPLGVHTYLPVDFCGTYDEDRLLERFIKANPDYIVLNSRDTTEYGKRGIGIDYGQKIIAWIKENYTGFKGHRSPAFQTVILKRK